MNQEDSEFLLSEKFDEELDGNLYDSIYSFTSEELPDSWVHSTIAMPKDFFPIFQSTIKAYQKLLNTQKTFPAIEAIFIEARNSLMHDSLDTDVVID